MANLRVPIINLKIPFFRDWVIRRIYDRDGNCITKGLNLVKKTDIGRYYVTSQGLSLFNSASTIPNEFKDVYSKFILRENKLLFYLIWNSVIIVLTLAFLIFCFTS